MRLVGFFWGLLLLGGAGGCASPSLVTDVTVTDNPSLVLQKNVAVTLSQASTVAIACTRDSHSVETHLVESTVSSSAHSVQIHGLVADESYSCTVGTPDQPEALSSDFKFTTDSLPSNLPSFSVDPAEGSSMVGTYTLVPHQRTCENSLAINLVMVDPVGEVRWYYPLPFEGYPDVGAEYYGDQLVLWGGSSASLAGEGAPALVDLSHNMVYQADYPGAAEAPFHHMAEAASDGTVITIADEEGVDGPYIGGPFSIHQIDVTNDELAWSWSALAAIEAGHLDSSYGLEYGANWAGLINDGQHDAMVVSLCGSDAIIGIDRDSGEVVWRMGERPTLELIGGDEWFSCTHGGDVSGNKLLVYDNGRSLQGSRALEYTIDPVAATATVTWEWTEDHWHEPAWGDVDYLAEDHVLIARAHAECFTFGAGPSQVVEVDRATDKVVWRLFFGDSGDGSYSADRIDGCEIFGNSAYCSTVADRLSALTDVLD